MTFYNLTNLYFRELYIFMGFTESGFGITIDTDLAYGLIQFGITTELILLSKIFS